MDIGREVFTNGLADPNLWSNRDWSTNLGLNWYLNRYVKFYLDWQHTEFGDPVDLPTAEPGSMHEVLRRWSRPQHHRTVSC